MSDTIIVKRTGQAPLRIRGELLSDRGSSLNNASSSYSGSTGHSQDVKVYKTASGKYVAAIHRTTCWQGEHDTDDATVHLSLQGVVGYLKDQVPGWMLEYIVQDLGEETVAEVVE